MFFDKNLDHISDILISFLSEVQVYYLTRILDKKLTRNLFQEQSFGVRQKQLRGGTGYGQLS